LPLLLTHHELYNGGSLLYGRHLAKKLPQATNLLEQIIQSVGAEIAPTPTEAEIVSASAMVPVKDASILTAAIQANVDYFLTLDHRHFKQPHVQQNVLFLILLPEEFVPLIRSELIREMDE